MSSLALAAAPGLWRRRSTFALGALALGSAATTPAQEAPFRPVDQAIEQPEFFVFRARLQASVARHDAADLTSILDPHIKTTHGPGGEGVKAFLEMWQPQVADSPLWGELSLVLALGGSFATDGDTFEAPYVSSQWPDHLMPFEHAAVLGTSVRVRSQPGVSASVVTTLDFGTVPLDPSASMHSAWWPVRLNDGRSGYVQRRFLRRAVDYRAVFSKREGRWRLRAFIAGD
jgi:Bacterial SH3 domain